MKWCRFQSGGNAAYGIIEGDNVIEVEGTPFGDHSRTSKSHPLSSAKLLVPVIPPTFYAAGINYPEHVTWPPTCGVRNPTCHKRPTLATGPSTPWSPKTSP